MEQLEIKEKEAITSHLNVWKSCLLKIKENVSMMTYNTWFLPIKPLELSDSTLKVQIPSQFFWEWIDEHFNGLITRSITDVLGKEAKLSYIIAEDIPIVETKSNGIPASLSVMAEKQKPKHNFESNLNLRYTFDNFIKGEGNQLARAAAGAISDNPGGTSFNPLFLYGGVGLGKTHLIQAIGNQIVKNFPEKKSYISFFRYIYC